MGVVVRRGRYGTKVFWNGKDEVVETRERKGVYEFVLKNGKVVRSDNRHLYEAVKRRLSSGK